MYYILSIAGGLLIALMIVQNGGLAEIYGVYGSTLLIHLAGLAVISIILIIKKHNPFKNCKCPYYLYLGGFFGVVTTVFNNISFAELSVSSLMALGLLGQSAASLAIDCFGLFGLPKLPFNKKKIIGIALIIIGVVLMMVL